MDPSKLKGLSREQKEQFLAALTEKEQRAKRKAAVYEPNDGQKQVHGSDKKFRLVISGNGAGKTCLGVNEAVWAARGFNPISGLYTTVPCRVVVILDKPDKVTDKWAPELKKWFDTTKWEFNKQGKQHVAQIILENGSEIKFMSHEQEPLSFESIEADFIVCDEPPPRHVYIAMVRGMRNIGHNPRMLIIGTPIVGSWLRKEIYEPWAAGEAEDTECFRFSTRVNEQNLAEGYLESFSSKLSEKEKRIRIEGEFFDLDGLALAHLFKRDKHLLPRDHEWDKTRYPCVVSIDPHPNKKHVALLVGADEYGPVVLKELALKAVPRDFARQLKTWMQGYRVIDIVCDSLGSGEYTGGEGFRSFIEVLNMEGIRARATTYNDKSETDWLARIQDVLAIPPEPDTSGQLIPQLRIIEGNTGLVNDIETVSWVKWRNLDEYKPSLDISNKDYLACLKYALACNLNYKRGKAQVYYRNHSNYGFKPPTVAKLQAKHRKVF